MYTLNSGDVSYIVPLDHIDLRFLRRNETVGDTVKPLWSPRQLEFSKFQVKAWRLADSEDTLDKDALKTTTCHICTIQVPVAYIKQHNDSKKHKNLLQIIDEVLSRLRSHIAFSSIATAEPPKSSYYCETCSIIVLIKDKDIHEGSSNHKKSLKHDEVLESFLFLHKQDKTDNLNDTVTSISDANNRPTPVKRVLRIATPLEHLKEYVNTITKEINSNIEIDVFDENFIIIKLRDSCMKVHIDKFHGFIKDSSDLVCLLCGITVTSKGHHIWTDQHMAHVTRSIADQHCIRQVNQDYAHCIICNELIRSVGGHKALALNHKENFENAQYNILDDKCQSLEMKQVDKIAASPPEQEKIEENAPLSNVENIEKISDKPIETETKYVHYLMSQTDNPKEVLCAVCRSAVPNLHSNIDEHINGRNHRNKYNELLTTNKMSKVQNGFACDCCRLHVENMKEMQHVSSQYHKKKLQTGIIGYQTYCEPCKVYIDTHNIAGHQNGQKHKQKATQQSTAGKDIKTSCDLVVISKSCNQNVSSQSKVSQTESDQVAENAIQSTSGSQNDQVNITGVNNAQGLMSVKQTPMTKEKNVEVPSSEAKLHYLLKETSNPMTLMCKVCKDIISNTANDIISHTNENNHITKYNNLLQKNKVEKVEFDFYCDVCEAKITNKNEVDHILNKRHRKLFFKFSNLRTHPLLEKIKHSEYQEKLHHFKYSSNINEIICRVCDVRMLYSVDNIVGHVNGYSHTRKYKDLLTFHRVFPCAGDRDFVCMKCNIYFAIKNEFLHISDNKHQKAMKSGDDDESSLTYSSEGDSH